MPDKDFLHRHPEFEALIRIVADQLGIDPYLAEKDYWVMHCLFGLQQAGYDFQLKGGTSLSKGHGLIHRFSEDIDIHISPPAGLELRTGKNHDKPQHAQGRKDYYDALAGEIAIDDIRAERDTAFDDERYYRSGGVRLIYRSHFDIGMTEAKEGVLLELGFDDVAPNTPVDIGSWAYDHAASMGVAVIDNRAKGVACYEAGQEETAMAIRIPGPGDPFGPPRRGPGGAWRRSRVLAMVVRSAMPAGRSSASRARGSRRCRRAGARAWPCTPGGKPSAWRSACAAGRRRPGCGPCRARSTPAWPP